MEQPGVIGGRDHFTDFDLDSREFSDNYDEVIEELLERCPVARGNALGGYWVVSRAEDFKQCAQDYETFTSTRGFEPAHSNEGEGAVKLYPLQLDPPHQTRWRQALGPYFSARAARDIEDSMRAHANYLIDSFVEAGSCDFVGAFAAQLPGHVFFGSFLGLPMDALAPVQKANDDAIRGPAEGRAAAWGILGNFLTEYLQSREKEPPRGDFVDAVLEGVMTEEGEPSPFEHKLFIMIDVMAGGMGTTSHVLASMAHHLATHPDDAARLVREPDKRASYVEEIIRVNAPVFALGRTATRDTEIAGQKVTEGDLVMLAEGAASRDPRVVDNPTTVDMDRKVPINLAFSYGPHRCIGSHVARLELMTALDLVLTRLPDLAVAPGEGPAHSNSGVARNMDRLPLVFTPSGRQGPVA